jgi:aspartyl/asparaginyl beta-hydroxylase (cupin superfamily)
MFYTAAEHPALKVLEDSYETILADYQSVADKTVPWFEERLHNGKWEAYGIKFRGSDVWGRECDRTAEIIDRIPGVYIAGFSVLKAGCQIKPHVGYTGDVWRAHLGLVCPPNCWIKVGGQQYTWKVGEVVVFDDTIEHSAANESDSDRVILIVDIKKV